MRNLVIAFVLASSISFFDLNRSYGFTLSEQFPETPDASLTPGKLCDRPDAYRYPEQIPYCNRAVSPSKKKAIIREYDEELDYHVGEMPRSDFKIDHYIPLCAGGSNDPENLWPQHKSVYQYTDPLEQPLCQKMAEGKLLQADAVDIIKRAKADPENAHELLEYLLSL